MAELLKINPDTWQDPFAFSQAIEVTGAERWLYCAGQLSVDQVGNLQYPNNMRAQMSLALDNVERILTEAGYCLADVVRLNVYTCDAEATLKHYDLLVQRLHAQGCQPAGIFLGVTRLALPDAMVEIEVTAVR